MDGKLTLEIINYVLLSLVFLFGLISLIFKNQIKKLIFLFMTFMTFGILAFLFLTGATFMLIAIIVIFFNIILFLYIQDIERFNKKGALVIEPEIPAVKPERKKNWKRIIGLIIAVISCAGIGYVFYEYSLNFFNNYEQTGNYTSSRILEIVAYISSNYSATLLLILSILIVTIIWFVAILKNGGSNDETKNERGAQS